MKLRRSSNDVRPPRWALIAAGVAFLGCASIIGVDGEYREVSDAATSVGGHAGATPSGASGGGQGGSDGVAGAGGDTCHDAPPAPGGVCPNICSGGCEDDLCVIDCGTSQDCEMLTINCPSNFRCELRCKGISACSQAALHCPDGYACNVTCDVSRACEGLVINCGSAAPCHIECSQSHQVCYQAIVNCGDKACTASCKDDENFPELICNNSCFCDACAPT